MDDIDIVGLPRLVTYFDPITWQARNPQHHLCIYKLNEDQLKMWGEEATEVRQKIMRRAKIYEEYSEPRKEAKDTKNNRRSIPHSNRSCNPEGLLESQLRARAQAHAGVTKSSKKRHMKELPPSTRDAIVKMYLVDHVFQGDIAKYFKISPMLVSRLVKEAQEQPDKNEKKKNHR